MLKFENNRLKGELGRMKREYFKRRRDEDAQKDGGEQFDNGYENYAAQIDQGYLNQQQQQVNIGL